MLTQLKKQPEYEWLNEVYAGTLYMACKQLDTAYKNFFREKKGFPKFKSSKHSKKSYTTNNQKGTVSILGNMIKLPKIGMVKAEIHRQPEENWIIKSATISLGSDDKYYASVLFQFDNNKSNYVPDIENAIGLDYASEGLYVDDQGNKGSNHKYYRESHEKLAKAQRKLSRKIGSKKTEEKSSNYLKQLKKVNTIHSHIAN